MLSKLETLAHRAATSPCITSVRNLRARYTRGYLKDLYHRRVLAGAEPLTHRSALPNWDYSSELYAFRHRVNAEDLSNETVVKALTSLTFFDRKDIQEDAAYHQPSLEENVSSREHNLELAMDGGVRLKSILSGYFRLQYPKAPEQYVNALVDQLTSDAALTSAATHLGMHHLVRTLDFPPTEDTLATAFKALISVLSYDRCKKTIAEAILPKIVGVAFEDVLPFSRPLEIVPHYAKKVYGESPKTEPRILHSSGLDTVTPLWVVGIYVNEQLVGSAPGETLPVAIDLAAQATLLRLWDVGVHRLAFQPNLLEQDLAEVPQNHSIYDVCPSEVDLSLLTPEELAQDPVNIFQAATNYYDLEKKLGRQRVKVLRHRFSRGSLFKRSFRYLVKPLPHSV